jgi:hypothetical protein
MKLSAKTIQVLKNFSIINPSLMFEEGNSLCTISPQKSIMAKAKIDETIEKNFGIFDLNRFLGVLTLFSEPTLTLFDNYVKISDDKKSVNFIFADPVTMVVPPKKDIKVSDAYVSFELKNEILQSVLKGASVLQLPEIAIEGNNGRLYCKAVDVKTSSNNSFEIDLQDESKKFKIIFSCNNLKLLSKDYNVQIAKGIAHFVSFDNEIEYYIATESSSTYGD